MRQTSELYKEIVADRFHRVECKLLIDGVEYGENALVSVETENNLFAEEAPSCGNAVSGTITAKLRTPNTIIRTKAKMELFARVTIGDLASEWIPKGVYFLDTREKQKAKNGEDTIIVLDGFDAILMGEQEYIPSGDWPKPDAEVIEEMCWILGVECTWIPNKNFPIQKPIGYSVREIIGYVAAMYGGSVTMDDSGKLKFVGLRKNQEGHEVVFSGLSVGDKLAPITKVTLHKMDGNKFTAGDDSGRTLNVDSPWASQEVADYILESVALYEYQPFTATDVIVDPAVEIGDVLNFGGAGKCCFHQNTVYGKSLVSTMGAMEEKELDHDYKYKSSSSWGTGRALSGLKAEQEELADSFGVRIEEVNSALNVYVKNTEEYKEANTELVSSIENNVSGLNLKVTNVETDVGELQTASAELTTRVSGAETALEMQSQSIDGLQTAQASLGARVDGAEASLEQKAEKSTVTDLSGKVSTIETAQASLGARVDGAEASIDLNAQNIDGVASSVAAVKADVIKLQGDTKILGNLSVDDGGVKVSKSVTANGAVTGTSVYANGSGSQGIVSGRRVSCAEIAVNGKDYTPTEITSTSGTVLVLGIA